MKEERTMSNNLLKIIEEMRKFVYHLEHGSDHKLLLGLFLNEETARKGKSYCDDN